MAAVTKHSDFGVQENKFCHFFHFFLIYLPWSIGPDAMILDIWMLSFKPAFSLPSFTFIKRLFSSSSLSAISMVTSVYLMLVIFIEMLDISNHIKHLFRAKCYGVLNKLHKKHLVCRQYAIKQIMRHWRHSWGNRKKNQEKNDSGKSTMHKV